VGGQTFCLLPCWPGASVGDGCGGICAFHTSGETLLTWHFPTSEIHAHTRCTCRSALRTVRHCICPAAPPCACQRAAALARPASPYGAFAAQRRGARRGDGEFRMRDAGVLRKGSQQDWAESLPKKKRKEKKRKTLRAHSAAALFALAVL